MGNGDGARQALVSPLRFPRRRGCGGEGRRRARRGDAAGRAGRSDRDVAQTAPNTVAQLLQLPDSMFMDMHDSLAGDDTS
ncbi:hypothetical protein EJB05_35343 [Eragrostis curvula]|uniref:Uncharacterized protein n=1 Tax=Eragrostis curvula TaxID=38414 RepID=A0A5J9U6H8_9POAL|nr:hypothetical protein EJB05_35343 [Eragrostis curvula]